MSDLINFIYLTPKGALILWGVSILIFFIFVIIFGIRISNSIKEAALNNGRINQYLAAVPEERIGTVNAVYENTRKDLAAAIALCLLGGTFGIQRIYLGRRKSALTMFFFFWTGIPQIISIFDLTNMPKTISEFNLSVVESLYNQIASPEIDVN